MGVQDRPLGLCPALTTELVYHNALIPRDKVLEQLYRVKFQTSKDLLCQKAARHGHGASVFLRYVTTVVLLGINQCHGTAQKSS